MLLQKVLLNILICYGNLQNNMLWELAKNKKLIKKESNMNIYVSQ